MTFAASGPTYQNTAITSNVLSSSGTYTWTKTGNNTGTAVLVDALTGITSSTFVTFTSTSGGTFGLVSGVGVQTGSFLWNGYSDLNPFLDVSTRGFVGTGSNILIGGFVIGGSIPKNVLIRAVGPTLASLGVTGTLSDPVVTIYSSSGGVIASNSGWANSATVASADASVGAFALNSGSSDAALVLTLNPGAYTAQVNGKSGDTGVALIEVYELPQ